MGRERERGRELASRTHGSATTTPSVREAIQASEEKNTVLAKRYGVDRKTIAKWKACKFSSDVRMGPKNPRSKFLTLDDERSRPAALEPRSSEGARLVAIWGE